MPLPIRKAVLKHAQSRRFASLRTANTAERLDCGGLPPLSPRTAESFVVSKQPDQQLSKSKHLRPAFVEDFQARSQLLLRGNFLEPAQRLVHRLE